MKKENQSFVFFGSGPVAAESLRLLQQSFTIEAVVTKPTTENEMRQVSGDSPLFTVSNRADLDSLFVEHNFYSKLGVLIDFGIIVSQQIIDYFELGIINSHFSLLPELRGADPISFAILEGKQNTGVSLMLLVEAMDEGPIITTGALDMTGKETTPILTNSLIKLSRDLLVDNLPNYIAGNIKPVKQNSDGVSYTRKLDKSDGIIDWSKPAIQIEREIRAYIEWPKSKATFSNIDCIVTEAEVINNTGEHGELFVQNKTLGVYCGKGSLLIKKIKPSGKKEMTSESFLAGYKSRLGL